MCLHMYVCLYVCMYVCMYNVVWKFEQVLSKEPLVSVFSFSCFFKGYLPCCSACQKEPHQRSWFKIDSAV